MEEAAQLTLPVGKRDHVQGDSAATLTLVEYGDYQCPHCGAAYPIVKAVQKRFGDKLKFVFRNFPLKNVHPQAELAAEAAEAAAAQGRFWEMHDAIFEHQSRLGEPFLLELAGRLKLDTHRFAADLAAGAFRKRVEEDFMSGVRSGVNGTPGFFIDGARYEESWDFETLSGVLEGVLEGA
jgi:protein-disulfide isomerase